MSRIGAIFAWLKDETDSTNVISVVLLLLIGLIFVVVKFWDVIVGTLTHYEFYIFVYFAISVFISNFLVKKKARLSLLANLAAIATAILAAQDQVLATLIVGIIMILVFSLSFPFKAMWKKLIVVMVIVGVAILAYIFFPLVWNIFQPAHHIPTPKLTPTNAHNTPTPIHKNKA